MLEPRKADLPVLFLFLVVLPLVLYFILGKWGEAAKKNDRVSLLAQLAAEEALRAEAMTAASVTPSPVSSSSKNGFYQCARCFAPAKTRCSRCKSIRYCSGKCQITHWRQVHKDECQQMETSSSFSPKSAFEGLVLDDFLINEEDNSSSFQQIMLDRYSTDNTMNASISSSISDISSCPVNDASQVSVLPRKSTEKRLHRKSHKETLRKEDKTKMIPPEETSRNRLAASSSSNTAIENESYSRQKTRSIDGTVSVEEIPRQQNVNGMVFANGNTNSRNTMHDRQTKSQQENACETRRRSRSSSSSYSELETKDCIPETSSVLHGNIVNNETAETNNASEMATSTKGSAKSKGASHSKEQRVSRSPKTLMKISAEQSLSGVETIGQTAETLRVKESTPAQGSLGVSSKRIMNLMGLRKSPKLSTEDATESNKDRYKRVKVLFPYDVFVKFFQYEDFSISPRGLLNCGNSCYANAVLQCLTSTKPLVNYLLSRSHSRAGCMKDWCLMCQLEQHITMLREVGPPLSPSRVLSHIRSINFQIGDGSQEDAHEFLRFLVTSMQSLSLEGLGGESKIDPRLQETTFVQHTFGGRLRSKVKCLKCHHESERYENIMDLTLEIYGWVESLEDALTQFTTPEELDGENKYRCGRCGTYVRARKQLSIHEAPNILTIVLKRFQEGKYGKITKCITFPELLDMVPFMTGKDDIPPLYLLYAVVVHLDTLNASFSGHYVSYVKDVRGNWLRIDDTEVQPVSMSQVMSEGAYILFYSRSCPRPPRAFTGKEIQPQSQVLYKHCESKSKKSSQLGQSKACSHFVDPEASQYLTTGASANFSNPTNNGIHRSTNRHIHPMMDNTDATSSSDWSIFTSSDDASFTTESTRDSFSTVDYADACNIDAFSSIFNSLYGSEHSRTNTISCRSFPNSKPQTRFAMETKGFVLDSYLSGQPLYGEQIREEQEEMVGGDSNRYPCGRNCSMYVKYESNLQEGYHHGYGRTSCHCNP